MKNNDSKLSGYLLIAIFVVPLLIAIVMYSLRDNLPMVKSVSHGQLIHPAQPIKKLEVQLHSGELINLDHMQGKWTYLVYSPESCDLNCEATLFKLRQTKIATGRESNRVHSIVVTKANESSTKILSRYRYIKSGNNITLKFEDESSISNTLEPGKVYLIDPLGNMMMYYNMDSTSRGMLKDIKKLLKISNIG